MADNWLLGIESLYMNSEGRVVCRMRSAWPTLEQDTTVPLDEYLEDLTKAYQQLHAALASTAAPAGEGDGE